MLQFVLRRITIFPITLVIANFIGFAFAFATAPIVTASDPYSFGTNKLPPVMPAYLDYLGNIFEGDFGSTFTNEPVLEAISRFGGASLGLLGIAITITAGTTMRATLQAIYDIAVKLRDEGPMAEATFIEAYKRHPLGDVHTFAGFDAIRALEDTYLPAEQLDKYSDSVGHQPEDSRGKRA